MSVASMTTEELMLLAELVEERLGLVFGPDRKDFLEWRIRPRLAALGLRRFFDYYLLLLGDGAELGELARAITNNETYFFRENYQFEALLAEGMGHLEPLPPGRRLRALSAACSSGEEAYTLNIHARQRLDHRAHWEIDGFDVDPDRIEKARLAEYRETSLRALDGGARDRYFRASGPGVWALRPLWREGVRFSVGNLLVGDTFLGPGRYDVVFCRNVLIYFGDAAFRRAIANLARALRPGGLLFLGHSESLIGRSDDFETVRLGRTIAYRRVSG